MGLGSKITCECPQAKISTCRQAPILVPITLKINDALNPNLPSVCFLTTPNITESTRFSLQKSEGQFKY